MFSNDNPGYTLDTYPPPPEAGVTTNGGWEVTTMNTTDPGFPMETDPGAALPINDWIYAILVITTAGMFLYFRKQRAQIR